MSVESLLDGATLDAVSVLVVDDEPDLADLIARRLEAEDDRITATAARSADEGMAVLADRRVDCVVSDYDMPRRDGLDFLESVRASWPDLPFVLYTGEGSEAVASEAVAAGVTDYRRKRPGDDYGLLANQVVNAVRQYRADRTRERLTELAENAADVLWMVSADWEDLLFVNSVYEDVWGHSTERLREDPTAFLEAVHPDDRERVWRAMDRLSDGVAVDVEYRVNEAEDYGRWVWAKGEPVTDDEGDVVRVAGFARDVTERKAREDELELKTRAMDEAPVGIIVTDFEAADNPIVYANPEFERLTGYDEAEVLGRNCRFLQGEGTDPEPVAELREAVAAGEPVTVELRNYRKDGTEFRNRVSIAPVRDGGRITHWVGFQQDVTGARERERALAREQAFLQQSLDALDDVFYIFGPDGEILRWNDRLPEVTGYDDEEIAGMRPTDFFPEDQTDRVAEAVAEVMETGSAAVRADYLTTDGERVPHEFTGWRLTGPDGDLLGFAGIGRDITDRLAYERRLERQNERLEEFASMVSHDLRNPLNVAQGRLALAREAGDDEHLDAVADAHDRMERLIEELLTLAKEGDVAVDPRPVAVRDVVETCWERVDSGEASLFVEDAPTIRADEERLEQLLANLFRNAADHGGDDVCVRVGGLDDGFYVADDGPGVPPAERDRVFEDGYTTREEGIGFGLSVVERIAAAHGWDVRVVASASGGARFEVTGVRVVDGPGDRS
ncbi:MAG: PAS domain S-box protein [Haloferacaceae archaeon]